MRDEQFRKAVRNFSTNPTPENEELLMQERCKVDQCCMHRHHFFRTNDLPPLAGLRVELSSERERQIHEIEMEVTFKIKVRGGEEALEALDLWMISRFA